MNGRFLGFRVRTFANIGAYHSSDRNAGPPTNNLGVLAGTTCCRRSMSRSTHAHQHHDDRALPRRRPPEAAYALRPWWIWAPRDHRYRPRRKTARRRNTIPPPRPDARTTDRPRLYLRLRRLPAKNRCQKADYAASQRAERTRKRAASCAGSNLQHGCIDQFPA